MERLSPETLHTSKQLLASKRPPKWLLQLPFGNTRLWLAAYKKMPQHDVVIRAAVIAFRRDNLLSLTKAATVLGVAPSTVMAWEHGKTKMQISVRLKLVRRGLFEPEHFGIMRNDYERLCKTLEDDGLIDDMLDSGEDIDDEEDELQEAVDSIRDSGYRAHLQALLDSGKRGEVAKAIASL